MRGQLVPSSTWSVCFTESSPNVPGQDADPSLPAGAFRSPGGPQEFQKGPWEPWDPWEARGGPRPRVLALQRSASSVLAYIEGTSEPREPLNGKTKMQNSSPTFGPFKLALTPQLSRGGFLVPKWACPTLLRTQSADSHFGHVGKAGCSCGRSRNILWEKQEHPVGEAGTSCGRSGICIASDFPGPRAFPRLPRVYRETPGRIPKCTGRLPVGSESVPGDSR